MTKPEALELLMLMSALESWAMAQQKDRLPDYLHDRISNAMDLLTKQVLEDAP